MNLEQEVIELRAKHERYLEVDEDDQDTIKNLSDEVERLKKINDEKERKLREAKE